MPSIAGARILIMASDGFEESELFGPRGILLKRGAGVTIAAPSPRPIQATVRDDPGRTIRPDCTIDEVAVEDFDALLLPGGLTNPDSLRTSKQAVALVAEFAAAGKPVAAICHGPWLLVEAGLVRGRRVTGWPSISTDLRNAGATLCEDKVVDDGGLITAEGPDDVEPFTDLLIAAIERT